MTVKRMWGYSENAVRIHLWIAIISYLLMAKIKIELQTPYSITEVARILEVSAFAKMPIRELLSNDQSTIKNQNVKELKLYYQIYCSSSNLKIVVPRKISIQKFVIFNNKI